MESSSNGNETAHHRLFFRQNVTCWYPPMGRVFHLRTFVYFFFFCIFYTFRKTLGKLRRLARCLNAFCFETVCFIYFFTGDPLLHSDTLFLLVMASWPNTFICETFGFLDDHSSYRMQYVSDFVTHLFRIWDVVAVTSAQKHSLIVPWTSVLLASSARQRSVEMGESLLIGEKSIR